MEDIWLLARSLTNSPLMDAHLDLRSWACSAKVVKRGDKWATRWTRKTALSREKETWDSRISLLHYRPNRHLSRQHTVLRHPSQFQFMAV